jgi:hypothetical protein
MAVALSKLAGEAATALETMTAAGLAYRSPSIPDVTRLVARLRAVEAGVRYADAILSCTCDNEQGCLLHDC